MTFNVKTINNFPKIDSFPQIHPISSKNNFHQIFIDSPHTKYKESHFKASLLKNAARIAAVATIVLVASALLISSYFVSPATIPLVLFVLTLSIPLLNIVYTNLYNKFFQLEKHASIYKGVADELDLIADWDDEKIKRELIKIELPLDKIPLDKLLEISPSPYKALLKPLAHYNYWEKQYLLGEELLESIIQPKPEIPENLTKKRKQAYFYYEKHALKAKLLSAATYDLMLHPERKEALSEIGNFKPQSFERRFLMKVFENKDTYFIFNDKNKAELGVTEIEDKNINELAQRIFHSLEQHSLNNDKSA